MRLFEAIIEANHRAAAGDPDAGLHPADYADALPLAALTCIDARLNPLLPNVLGLRGEHFVWLRNAGNVVTGPLSSTLRSLALACAVKGAKEIALIGHTDCQVCRTSTTQLLERLKNLGVERHLLPDNVNEYFGLFSSERQNVIKGCEIVRSSPLIGPRIPVHGLLLDIETGRVEWVVNGYQTWAAMSSKWNEVVASAGETVDKLKSLADFNLGEMKFPETKIGEAVTQSGDWLSRKLEDLQIQPTAAATPPRALNIAAKVLELAEPQLSKPPAPAAPPLPPKIPIPPPIRVRANPPSRGKKK